MQGSSKARFGTWLRSRRAAGTLDRRADIWAIGVCLHELATGRLPYDDDSDVDVVRRLISDEPPPSLDEVPGPVAEILRHSLVRDPNERFSTAAAMRRAIDNAMAEMHMQTSSEDVADFVRINLPEFAEKRHKIVAKAMAEADERAAARGSTSLVAAEEARGAGGEEAFAPTIMSKANLSSADDRVTVKPDPKGATAARAIPRARDVLEGRVAADESVGGAFTDEEVAALPKKRGWLWLLAFAAIVAGAWFGWPGGPRIRAVVASVMPQANVPVPTAATTASVATTTASAVVTAPSASATQVASAATVASAGVTVLDAARAVPSVTQSRPRPTSQDVTFSAPPLQPTIDTTTAPPPPPPPTQTATTTPPEENNPY